MDFSFTPEQEQLRASLSGYLRDHHDLAARQAAVATEDGRNRAIWHGFVDQLGILGLSGPEAPDPFDLLVVMQELGAALVAEPFLETAITSATLLRTSSTAAATGLLHRITTGEAIVVFADTEPGARLGTSPANMQAEPVSDGWCLSGAKSMIMGAPWATTLLVSANTPDGPAVFAVDPDGSGVALHPYRTIDGRRAADIRLEGVVVPSDQIVTLSGSAATAIEAATDATIVALAAEALGIMRRILDDTIAYTRQRRQFGQSIASFQALQHRMVDMFMKIEAATSATYLATMKLSAPPRERALAISGAKVLVGEACRFVGQNGVQLHGGMGMTEELAVGHYFKRATVIEGLFGTSEDHLARYMAISAAPSLLRATAA
ncbi:acyl-CoA dehydrogenase family protein [Sphingomonas sp. IC4-52]|uniref:acyl-CoA dehydrogenase family protein n=1 Tax=Sphingomonas sp. IC4-52 TaxID=2887202 RepID=UPI001D10F26D|nr:acyl-CoA dehydrogenase family protein [Sphingomonas sp. IC4-52]MCC2979498.1 acyl-CoA dehydrogenase family protein [Sphingomonas sp. IC4-52]